MDDPAAQGRRAARAAAGPRPREEGTAPPARRQAAVPGGNRCRRHVHAGHRHPRYGKRETVRAAAVTCLWYSVFGTRHVQVVLLQDKSSSGYDLALVTTDLDATPAQVIERYASRWAIEVAIEDAKQEFGAGQARNRTANAVRRTIPFQLTCQTIAMTWYATAGHDPADIDDRRARAPWYRSKARPSTADMLGKLRRVLIAARFKASRPDLLTSEEIRAIRLAWEVAAA